MLHCHGNWFSVASWPPTILLTVAWPQSRKDNFLKRITRIYWDCTCSIGQRIGIWSTTREGGCCCCCCWRRPSKPRRWVLWQTSRGPNTVRNLIQTFLAHLTLSSVCRSGIYWRNIPESWNQHSIPNSWRYSNLTWNTGTGKMKSGSQEYQRRHVDNLPPWTMIQGWLNIEPRIRPNNNEH